MGIGNVRLDFIQGACTESVDGQVQGTTTDPSHKNYIWDPSGLFSIILHEFIDDVILVVTLYYFVDVTSST